MGDDYKNLQVQPEGCQHTWGEIEHIYNAEGIKVFSECKKCGARLVERYKFVEAYELDKEGKVINTYWL